MQIFASVVCIILFIISCECDDIAEPYFNLYHSVSGRFTLRSRIQLITKADGQSQFVFLDKNIISVEDISDFKNLLVENDFYQIKLQAVSGNASGPMVLSSIPSVRKEYIPSN